MIPTYLLIDLGAYLPTCLVWLCAIPIPIPTGLLSLYHGTVACNCYMCTVRVTWFSVLPGVGGPRWGEAGRGELGRCGERAGGKLVWVG